MNSPSSRKISRQVAWQRRKLLAGKCMICGKDLNDSNGTRCMSCKQKQREIDLRRNREIKQNRMTVEIENDNVPSVEIR